MIQAVKDLQRLREMAFLARRRKYQPGVAWRRGNKQLSKRAQERKLGIEPDL